MGALAFSTHMTRRMFLRMICQENRGRLDLIPTPNVYRRCEGSKGCCASAGRELIWKAARLRSPSAPQARFRLRPPRDQTNKWPSLKCLCTLTHHDGLSLFLYSFCVVAYKQITGG